MSSPIAIGYNKSDRQFEGVYVHWTPEPEQIKEFITSLGSLEAVQEWVSRSAQEGGFSSIEEVVNDTPYGEDHGSGLITNDSKASNYVDGFWVVDTAPFTMDEVKAAVEDDYDEDEAYNDFCNESGIGHLVPGTDLAITYFDRSGHRFKFVYPEPGQESAVIKEGAKKPARKPE